MSAYPALWNQPYGIFIPSVLLLVNYSNFVCGSTGSSYGSTPSSRRFAHAITMCFTLDLYLYYNNFFKICQLYIRMLFTSCNNSGLFSKHSVIDLVFNAPERMLSASSVDNLSFISHLT